MPVLSYLNLVDPYTLACSSEIGSVLLEYFEYMCMFFRVFQQSSMYVFSYLNTFIIKGALYSGPMKLELAFEQ